MLIIPELKKVLIQPPRMSRGEMLGYQVIAHKTDRSSTPITNSDFERVSA